MTKNQNDAASGMPMIEAENLLFFGKKTCPAASQGKNLPRHCCRAPATAIAVNETETIFSG
jgi:hypothetical protein